MLSTVSYLSSFQHLGAYYASRYSICGEFWKRTLPTPPTKERLSGSGNCRSEKFFLD